MMIVDVLRCIEQHPEQPGWEQQQWAAALSAVTGWRSLIADQAHWPALERATPRSDHGTLAHVLVEVAGAGLARRWLTAGDAHQRSAAGAWWDANLDWIIGSPRWAGLATAEQHQLIDRRAARIENLLAHGEQLRHRCAQEVARLHRLARCAAEVHDHATGRSIAALLARTGDGGAGVTDMARFLERRYTPTPFERELIARLLDQFQRGGYTTAVALPRIIMSDAQPPLLARHPELLINPPAVAADAQPMTYPVDALLGQYRPVDQTIVLYARGIAWYSRHRQQPHADDVSLRAVVLLCRIALWAMHLLTRPGARAWSLERVLCCDSKARMGIAYLITLWIADDVAGAVKQSFEQLMKDQPDGDHFYEELVDWSRDAIIASLDFLRTMNSGDASYWWDAITDESDESDSRPTAPDASVVAHPSTALPVDRVGAEYLPIPSGGGSTTQWMMRTPVTNAMWRQAVAAGVCAPPDSKSPNRWYGAGTNEQRSVFSDTVGEIGGSTHWYDAGNDEQRPVIGITLLMARQYAAWIGGRLPREAERAWAARFTQTQHPLPSADALNAFLARIRGRDTLPRGVSANYAPDDPSSDLWFESPDTIWEWTEFNQPTDPSHGLVCRAWSQHGALSARSGTWLEIHAAWRSPLVGFRVVLSDA